MELSTIIVVAVTTIIANIKLLPANEADWKATEEEAKIIRREKSDFKDYLEFSDQLSNYSNDMKAIIGVKLLKKSVKVPLK